MAAVPFMYRLYLADTVTVPVNTVTAANVWLVVVVYVNEPDAAPATVLLEPWTFNLTVPVPVPTPVAVNDTPTVLDAAPIYV